MKKEQLPIIILIIFIGIALVIALFVRGYMIQRQLKESPTVITVKPGTLKANVKGNVTLACYDHKTNTIYLDEFHIRRSGYTKEQVMKHEITHARQWQTRPVWCILNHLLPYQLRPMEKEAKIMTEE